MCLRQFKITVDVEIGRAASDLGKLVYMMLVATVTWGATPPEISAFPLESLLVSWASRVCWRCGEHACPRLNEERSATRWGGTAATLRHRGFLLILSRFTSVPMPDTWSQAMSIAKCAILGPTPGSRTSPSTLSGMSPSNSFCSIADVSFRYFTLFYRGFRQVKG